MAAPVAAQAAYAQLAIIDLGTLGGYRSESIAINERGQVVGVSLIDEENEHAFLWKKGTMTDLGILASDYSSGEAINSRGQVMGTSATDSGEPHAVLWTR